ncbi:MAG TPA: FAD-dependent oxidoreductase, partial [Spirochaetia bacterium]|nr:FAD-dependent oxidoreductase [Spirochaetia bacterium]
MPNAHFDLIVIGGGPSGFAGAMRALDYKKSVLLVEKTGLGGTEVFNGVMTSKTLWEYSKKVKQIRELVPGFDVKFEDSDKEVREAVKSRRAIINNHLRILLEESTRHLFHLEKGRAELMGRNEVR